MMRLFTCLALAALLLAGTACSSVPFRPTRLTPTGPSTAAALTEGLWDAGNGTYLIRHSALFEFQGMRTPLAGVMRLDTGRKSARLVGMNEMGVKLFDLAIDRSSHEALFIMPELASYPGFAEAVAASVQRIFLSAGPARDDALTVTPRSYRLSGNRDGKTLLFTLGGKHGQLLEKSCSGPGEEWRVRYYEHQWQQLLPIPRGIVLDDERAGYRLTLWIESVEQSDE